MKVNIIELRDMIAEAVRLTLAEKKGKKKVTAPHSEESVAAQRDRHVRSLPGYAHGDDPLDMSKPLGVHSLPKRQGASGMGGWTSEGRVSEQGLRALVKLIVAEELTVARRR